MDTPKDKIYEAACNHLAEMMYYIDARSAKHVESPIEEAMVQALYFYAVLNGMTPKLYYSSQRDIDIKQDGHIIILQQEESGYRVDIVFISGLSTPPIKIAIECDGHDFHEKTKKQAARDKMRDRVLATKFDAVLRFTGSEIYNNAWGCATQVGEVMISVWHRRNETENAILGLGPA